MFHFIKNSDLTPDETLELINRADNIYTGNCDVKHELDGYQMGVLFYEPSTRTRLSFMSAMNGLGGTNIGFESSDSASVVKGESLADTIRVVSQYTDIITLRHPDVSAPIIASSSAEVPIINGGNGSELHPTQTLADLMTIMENKHSLTGLDIVFAGDLKYGRTVHSLVRELLRFGNNSFTFVSDKRLAIPNDLRTLLVDSKTSFREINSFDKTIIDPDIIYLTRIQTERFSTEGRMDSLSSYIESEKISDPCLGKNTLLMHPLPRGKELPTVFDSYSQAKYFDQVKFGKYMRMALIEKMLTMNNQL